MIKIIALIFGCLFSTASLADNVIIGFRGQNGVFDQQAFFAYAAKRNLKPVVLNANDQSKALSLIKGFKNYELYGYSLGASSVMYVVKQTHKSGLPKPRHVITIGAYYSTNVDFRPYNVSFKNYFDASGKGQRSPGIHIPAVSHSNIQRYINTID